MTRFAPISRAVQHLWHHALAAPIALGALGLLSRQTPRISPQVGDALCAALLYATLRALRPTWTPRTTAAAALGLALTIELSQALHTPTLDALRASVLGGALLGRGCSLADLLCAPIGVALAHGMARSWRKSALTAGRQRLGLRARSVVGRAAALLVLTTAVEVATFVPHAPERADAAVVLGAAVWHDRPSPVLRMRIDRAVALQRAGTVQALIFTGGRGDGDVLSEAAAGRARALALGVPATATAIEDRSSRTRDNLANAFAIADARGWRSLVVVSDRLHLCRARWLAARAGRRVGTVARSEHDGRRLVWRVNDALREAVLLLWARISAQFADTRRHNPAVNATSTTSSSIKPTRAPEVDVYAHCVCSRSDTLPAACNAACNAAACAAVGYNRTTSPTRLPATSSRSGSDACSTGGRIGTQPPSGSSAQTVATISSRSG